jgi:hypothetical protein
MYNLYLAMLHRDIYINKLNGCELTPPSLVNFNLLEYCYEKNKESITDHNKAMKILEQQRWTDWSWGHSRIVTVPKHIYHVDFDLFTAGEYPNLMDSLITRANAEHRNITTSIHLKLSQPEVYYYSWCCRLDKFLTNNVLFDYLNIYIEANELQLADAWLNTPVYTSYSNVFDVIRCSSLANLTKVNVMYVKKLSKKTGRPIYENILKSRMGLGWPLNLYNKLRDINSQITLTMMDDGKTAYIKNIHITGEDIVKRIEKYWKNRTFDAIEFDSRLIVLPNATCVDGKTRYRVELTPLPKTKSSRLSALLPWLRSYVGL